MSKWTEERELFFDEVFGDLAFRRPGKVDVINDAREQARGNGILSQMKTFFNTVKAVRNTK